MSETISGRDPRTGETLNVHVENGRIAAIENDSRVESAWLIPGLIDLQVNGCCGTI